MSLKIKIFSIAFILTFLTGCETFKSSNSSIEVISGPPISTNVTPYTKSVECAAQLVHENSGNFSRKLRIAVDRLPDLTGKINVTEGSKITQGVDYMAITALQKFENSIQLVERSSIHLFNLETELTHKQLVGDGRSYKIQNGDPIHFRPLFRGSVYNADYFITGAITELNYNIYSGGGLLGFSGFIFGNRKVVLNIALDLRIVNMHNLKIEKSISLQKQIVGNSKNADFLDFVSDDMVSFEGGNSRDEPLHRGVRSLVEQGVSNLIGEVMRVSTDSCFEAKEGQDLNT